MNRSAYIAKAKEDVVVAIGQALQGETCHPLAPWRARKNAVEYLQREKLWRRYGMDGMDWQTKEIRQKIKGYTRMNRSAYIARAKDDVIVAIGQALQGEVCHPLTPWRARKNLVDYLQRAGAYLHGRYERSCSYEWACTDDYAKGTENREHRIMAYLKTMQFPGTLEFQGDPRGWPLILTIDEREYRLGGRVTQM